MALQNVNGKFKGKVGDLTYRIVNGQSIVQSRPGKGNIKQTAPTKASAIDFSLASNRAKILRIILFPMIQAKQDSGMINRLTNAVASVVRSNHLLAPGSRDLDDGDLNLLDGFEFNLHSLFVKLFRPHVTLRQTEDGFLQISIPAFRVAELVSFPEPATGLNLRILLAAVDLKTNQYRYCGTENLFIPLQRVLQPASEWNFPDHLNPGCIYIACCALEYNTEGMGERILLNHAKLQPVFLLGLRRGLGLGQHLPLPVNAPGLWNNWMQIPGLDGRELRKV